MVHPPVDTEFFRPDPAVAGSGALVVSALVPYKRIEVAVEACRKAGLPLRIVGHGPEFGRLAARAGSSVTFLGSLSNEEIRDEYRRARVVLLPGEEDFGIVPVEAQACGRPVVALARGGALETIVDSRTGVLVAGDTAEAFAEGLERARWTWFDPDVIRRHAESFGRERFAKQIGDVIGQVLANPSSQMSW